MKYTCPHCSCEFNSKSNLNQHEKNSVYCQNFAYILFLCKKCFKSFNTIKDIQSHFKDCLDGGKTCIDLKINHYIQELSTAKKYSKLLRQLKSTRREYLYYMSLEEYKVFILDHFKNIKVEFDKRVNTKIHYTKVLSPLELRLIKYKKNATEMDVEEREFLKVVIKKNPNYNYLNSYCVAIFSIQELASCFINKIGSYKGTLYYRPNIKKNIWIFDKNLTYFTLLFSENFIIYCTSLYRDIYKRVFGNNIFKPDMHIHSPLIDYDCNQLLYNLWMVSTPMFLNNLLLNLTQPLIDENSIFKKVNKNKKIKIAGVKETIRLLYDNITDAQLDEFSTFCKKKFDI